MGKRGRKKRTKEEQIEAWTIRYGPKFMEDITTARARVGITLSDLAQKYNLTRQYISWMYQQIHGEKYFPMIATRRNALKEDLSCTCDPRNQFELSKLRGSNDSVHRNLLARSRFVEECKKREIPFEFNPSNKPIITLYGKYNIFVAFASIKTIQKNWCYFVSVRNIQKRHSRINIDFMFIYMHEEDSFFVINMDQQYVRQTFYLSGVNDTRPESQYKRSRFVDRWDLIQNGAK